MVVRLGCPLESQLFSGLAPCPSSQPVILQMTCGAAHSRACGCLHIGPCSACTLQPPSRKGHPMPWGQCLSTGGFPRRLGTDSPAGGLYNVLISCVTHQPDSGFLSYGCSNKSP